MQVNYSYTKYICYKDGLCITDRNMSPSSIATALKEALKNSPYTQTELGQKIGVTQGTISKYINGEQPIPSDDLEKLCLVLGVKLTIDGAEEPWELREAIVKIRELHPISRDAVGRILLDAEVIIRAHRGVSEGVIPKEKAARKGGKKEKNSSQTGDTPSVTGTSG